MGVSTELLIRRRKREAEALEAETETPEPVVEHKRKPRRKDTEDK
jgi:hypothetical protein